MSQIIPIRQQAKVVSLIPTYPTGKVDKSDKQEFFSLFRSHVKNLKEMVQLVEKAALTEMTKNPHSYAVTYANAARLDREVRLLEHYLDSASRQFRETHFTDMLQTIYGDMSPLLDSDFI